MVSEKLYRNNTLKECFLNISNRRLPSFVIDHCVLYFQEKACEAGEETVDNDKMPPSPGSRPSSGQEAVWIPGKHQVETVARPGKCRGRSKKPREEYHFVKILNTVEFFSRLLFPIVFLFLNVAYWLYYGGILE